MEDNCPRCGNNEFEEIDCGPDGWEDDITWCAYICTKCGLWYSDWQHEWLVDVASWIEEDGAEVFKRERIDK